MTTLIIFSTFEDLPKFAIIDGDYSYLDRTVINTYDYDDQANWDAKCNELTALIYDSEDGHDLIDWKKEFPADDYYLQARHGTIKIINVGFAP